MGDSAGRGAGLGLMAAFAVSGSVVILIAARHVHNRLLSEIMEQIDSEFIGSRNYQVKKKVRFAEDVVEPSSNNEEYRKKCMAKLRKAINNHHRDVKVEMLENMPLNRQVMYKSIIEAKRV